MRMKVEANGRRERISPPTCTTIKDADQLDRPPDRSPGVDQLLKLFLANAIGSRQEGSESGRNNPTQQIAGTIRKLAAAESRMAESSAKTRGKVPGATGDSPRLHGDTERPRQGPFSALTSTEQKSETDRTATGNVQRGAPDGLIFGQGEGGKEMGGSGGGGGGTRPSEIAVNPGRRGSTNTAAISRTNIRKELPETTKRRRSIKEAEKIEERGGCKVERRWRSDRHRGERPTRANLCTRAIKRN